MSPIEAQVIINALANGAHPETGEVLPSEGPLSHANVVRALFAASKALGEAAHRTRLQASRPGNAGKPWSPEEDAQLLQAFDGGQDMRELAGHHQRSAGSIRLRLLHLGRLQEPVAAK
jgi:hypothetical protein